MRQGNRDTRPLLLFVDALFHRVGELAWATWPCGDPASPIRDDVGSIERVFRQGGVEHDQISLSCLRTLVNTFLIVYRLVHWMQVSADMQNRDRSEREEREEDENGGGSGEESSLAECADLHQHHVTASLDVFYRMSMFYDLPPAARLNYRHMFSGLYNCISQPLYYHNPDYQRRMLLPLKAIKVCSKGALLLRARTHILLPLCPPAGLRVGHLVSSKSAPPSPHACVHPSC